MAAIGLVSSFLFSSLLLASLWGCSPDGTGSVVPADSSDASDASVGVSSSQDENDVRQESGGGDVPDALLSDRDSSRVPTPAERLASARSAVEEAARLEQLAAEEAMRAHVAGSPYEVPSAPLYGNEAWTGELPVVRGGLSMASDTVPGTVAAQELLRAIGEVEADGYHVAVSLCDLSGTELLGYDQDSALYPASSIKGPYVMSVWRELSGGPSSFLRGRTEALLGWSDNDAYRALQQAYGPGPIRRLAEETGCDLSWYGGSSYSWSQWYYPRVSPHDLCRLWQGCVGWLFGGSGEATEIQSYFFEREVSPLRDALPYVVTTYSKAGWLDEGGDYDSTPAAVDAGVVMWPDGRAYIVAVMTDTEEDMEAVSRIAACVDRCHYAIVNPAG